MVQKNKSLPIKSVSNEKMIGSSGAPTNLKSIGKEMILEAEGFPYSFTLLCASLYAGEEGSGKFTIEISSNDKSMKFEELN